jgi:predicted RNase H-like HicB family nuclease
MKPQDRYLMFVRWSEDDQLYVGYCPDLFPAGGVCHGPTAVDAFAKLCDIVEDTVTTSAQNSLPLPEVTTRPMREIEAVA